MSINSDQVQEICNGVWRDRAMLLQGRGFLNGDAALMRAVYWRLSKAGIKVTVSAENYGSAQTLSSYEVAVNGLLEIHGRPRFDAARYLNELVQLYNNELRDNC